nr:aspartate kinase [Prolixibacteraceae bacterium]
MKVFKFGGTSVGSPENMRAVMNIITDGEPKIVVLSAMSGTTNTLVEISNYLYDGKKDKAKKIIADLKAKYAKVVVDLYETTEYRAKGQDIIDQHFDKLEEQAEGEFGPVKEQVILAQGELISTALVTYLLNENGHDAMLLPSLEFMRINADKQADL